MSIAEIKSSTCHFEIIFQREISREQDTVISSRLNGGNEDRS